MEFIIEPMQREDWGAVRAIYQEGIDGGDATFETLAPEWEEWDADHISDCRIVAKIGGRLVAWGALSPVSSRCAYQGVAEVSIYVTRSLRGEGAGRTLLLSLIEESEMAGFWTLQAGIFPENGASLSLVESCGFKVVGCRSHLGCLDGQWRDVVLVERRSKVTGI
jgi:L-amino acid N-acyltransferase YncA